MQHISGEFTFTLVDQKTPQHMIFIESDRKYENDSKDLLDEDDPRNNLMDSELCSPLSYRFRHELKDVHLYPKPINETLVVSSPEGFSHLSLGVYNLRGIQFFPNVRMNDSESIILDIGSFPDDIYLFCLKLNAKGSYAMNFYKG